MASAGSHSLAAFLGLDPSDAAIAAAVAVLLAVLRAFAYLVSGRRERERQLYGNAYRAAMAWRQMLYRVRTRPPGSEQKLLRRFDDLQVEIDYYQGWVSSEGRWIGRSYSRLVSEIRRKTIPLLEQAWRMSDEERLTTNGNRDQAGHPETERDSERFLDDVRNHLSFFIVPKLCVVRRNRRRLKTRVEVDRAEALQLLDRLHRAQNDFYSGGSGSELGQLLADDIVWVVPGENRIAGTYRGLEAVLDYFRRRRDLADQTFRMARLDLLVGGGKRLAALTDGSARIKGTEHRWSTVGLYEITDGQISGCWLLPLDQVAFDAIWSS